MQKLLEIFTCDTLTKAYFYKSALESQNIHVVVKNEFLQGAIGGLPPGLETYPRILVFEKDAERALELIQDTEERLRDSAPEDDDFDDDETDDEVSDSDISSEVEIQNVGVEDVRRLVYSIVTSQIFLGFIIAIIVSTVVFRILTLLIYGENAPPIFE
jgi:hypothetical protein